jgi:hypothetical protein
VPDEKRAAFALRKHIKGAAQLKLQALDARWPLAQFRISEEIFEIDPNPTCQGEPSSLGKRSVKVCPRRAYWAFKAKSQRRIASMANPRLITWCAQLIAKS